MRWDKVRKRLDQKLREVGVNKAEASRYLGRSPGFVHDFLTGKQKTLGDEDVHNLAALLKVRETWLLSLDELVVAPEQKRAASAIDISGGNIDKVGETERRDVHILSLDLRSGDCILVTSDSQQVAGKIVDPALFQPNSKYGLSLINRQMLTAVIKKVETNDGDETWFIIDAE